MLTTLSDSILTPATQSPWLFINLKANPRVAIRFGCTTALSQAPMEGGHRKTTPPLQQGALGFHQWSNPKKLKGVLRNQTSSETSLEFFPKCYFSLLTCKVINHLSDKGEVMWCQYDQVLVASEIFDFHIQSLHIWGLKNCISFQILQIVGIYVKFPGGGGVCTPKKTRENLQQRWIV